MFNALLISEKLEIGKVSWKKLLITAKIEKCKVSSMMQHASEQGACHVERDGPRFAIHGTVRRMPDKPKEQTDFTILKGRGASEPERSEVSPFRLETWDA